MLLGTLHFSLLGNMIPGKGAIVTRADKGKIRAGKSMITADKNF